MQNLYCLYLFLLSNFPSELNLEFQIASARAHLTISKVEKFLWKIIDSILAKSAYGHNPFVLIYSRVNH